jgi:hypothetical protein
MARPDPTPSLRRLSQILAALALGYVAYGLWLRAGRAPRPAPPPGEIHGAYHVHTTKSDGRGTLEEVIEAASEAGLQFVVVTDHNVLSPEDAGYRGGVLVVEGSEVSAPYGHIVALGIPRELTREERQKDTIGNIRALGGQATIAHPFHPRRPFTRWSNLGWLGYEAISNDSFWGLTLRSHEYWRIAEAILALPWDGASSALAFYRPPLLELAMYDALSASERHPLLCANDAHGWPSYRAAFEAFSMHLPVALSGDAGRDVPAVIEELLGGRAYCVLDGVAPAWGVRLGLSPGRDRIELSAPIDGSGLASYALFHDGAPAGPLQPSGVGLAFACDGPCPGGAWRVEGRWSGRPWIFTNPLWIE